LYVSSEDIAKHVVDAICQVGFINRGPKYRDNLYFLNQTDERAILIEVCFVDSKADADLYRAKFSEICRLIAASIAYSIIESE
jgi:N-acetylmuramoyl-L-alanine amidase